MIASNPPPIAPPPAPADVGIVAALGIEVAPLLAKLAHVRKYSNDRHSIIEGELAGKIVVVILSGPGRAAARKGANLLLAGHKPRWMLSAGFGGGLDPSLTRDQILFGTEVVDPDGLTMAIPIGSPDDERLGIRSGRIVTVDQIIRTAGEKAVLRERTGADIVDMETSAVALVCRDRNIRFVAIRVVSDEAAFDLPPEIAAILGRSGGYRVGAALHAIWKRPSSLKDMLALRERAMSAAERLARVVPGIIETLP
jgi:adenosylhomocysteine nucleosidase